MCFRNALNLFPFISYLQTIVYLYNVTNVTIIDIFTAYLYGKIKLQ